MIPRLHFPGANPEFAESGQEKSFTPEQSRRLFRVLRMRAGDAITLFDGEGCEFAAEIVSLRPDSGAARIVSRRPPPLADAGIRIRVGQGLCAPNKMDWAVEKMTELGALEIVPLRTAKTAASARFSAERAGRLAVAACEQCGRARVPRIGALANLREFLSRPFPDSRRILLSPRAGCSLESALESTPESAPDENGKAEVEAALLCGPESGFTLEEETEAEARGWIPASLGPRILRAETAALAALAAANSILSRRAFRATRTRA